MTLSNSRGRAPRAALFVAFAALVSATAAAQAKKFQIDIAAGNAAQSLTKFIEQTGFQVLYSPDAIKDHRTKPVSGKYEPNEAIKLMLAESGLVFEVINENTITVVAERASGDKPSAGSSFDPAPIGNSSGARRLVQAESAESDAAVERDPVPKSAPLDEVVVTGTHIRGSEPVGSKVIIIDRDYIAKSGFATVADVLKTLPQTAPGPSEDDPGGGPLRNQPSIGNFGWATGVNLRGLGAGATLVLVNGVRQPTAGLQGRFVDVSAIPLGAIERIEVLPDGASALYGSDAIGGVVNIILRKNYRGFETDLRLGTMDGDATETRIAPLFGFTWPNGHATVGYEHYKREMLRAVDRSFAADSDQTPHGGSDFSYTFSSPGNILCPYPPPPELNCSPYEAAIGIPKGQDGTHLSREELLASSTVHLVNANLQLMLLPEERMDSGFFDIGQDLGTRVSLFARGRYSTRPAMQTISLLNTFTVPSSNPFYVDVFGTPELLINYDFGDDYKLRVESQTDTLEASLGATIKLGRDWVATIQSSYGRQDMDYAQVTIDEARIAEALRNQNRETALNLFGDHAPQNPQTMAGILRLERESVTSKTINGNLSTTGPLLRLPGGSMKLAAGLDYHRDELATGSLATRAPLLANWNGAAFAELLVPIVGPENQHPGISQLQASLAARYENYSDWGDTVVPKFGLSWAPVKSLKFRSSWGKSFRAPPLINSEETVYNYPIAFAIPGFPDPDSPTGFSTVLLHSGANPGLREERGVEWTTGLDFTPEWLPGLEASLMYFNNDYTDRVGVGGTPGRSLLDEPELWSTLITRNPTQAQLDAVCTGERNSPPPGSCDAVDVILDLRLQNIAVTQVEGLDLALRHLSSTTIGDFDLGLAASYIFHNKFALAKTTTPIDMLDIAGNQLSLRIRGTAGWSRAGFGVHGTLSYAPGYDDPLGGVDGTTRPVSSWTTLNLGASYRRGQDEGWLSNTGVTLNVVNVFDEDPPFVNLSTGYDFANADPYGRIMSVDLVKSW